MIDIAEFDKWFRQGEQTLLSAKDDQEKAHHNWACFKAQQAAEFALKGLLHGLGNMAIGHSITKLLEEVERIGLSVPEALRIDANTLDKHYIPTRYADAYDQGSPYEFYNGKDSTEAIAAAQRCIDYVHTTRQGLDSARPEETEG